MGKPRDLFKKIEDTEGTFHARMGPIKDRNRKDLTEAEEIKKRWEKYTEELYEKGLNDPENHDIVVILRGPDILECEFRGVLESIMMNKASGGDGIPAELFEIVKYDDVKEKVKEFQKNTTSASLITLITLKPLTGWITTNCGKFLKR